MVLSITTAYFVVMEAEAIILEIEEMANEVYDALGTGFNETIYQSALSVLMRERRVGYETERNVEIMFKGHSLGLHRLDFVVEYKVIVEVKRNTSITEPYRAQVRGYMKTTGLTDAIILNFPYNDENGIQIETINKKR